MSWGELLVQAISFLSVRVFLTMLLILVVVGAVIWAV